MQPASFIINARRFAQDLSAVNWSNNDWGLLLDEAAKLLQNEVKPLKNRTSLSIVANQRVYAMANNVLVPQDVEYSTGGYMNKLPGKSLEEFRLQRMPTYGAVPFFYTYFDDEQSLALTPIPNASADTTTLTGSHNASVTTLTVGSTASFFAEGRVIVDSEVIGYTGTTSTTLTGCTRGMEGTTAASHSGGATVTERDLFIYGIRRPTDREMSLHLYSTGTIAITINTTALVGTNTVWTANASAGDYFGITSDTTKLDPIRWYKIATVNTDTSITLADTYLEATQSTGTYIITSPNPFPNQYDAFFRSYLMSRAMEKDGDLKGASQQWSMVERMLHSGKASTHKPDSVMHPRGRHDHMRRPFGRMAVSGGPTYV